MSELKPGSRWKSAVDAGEFVIVRPPASGGELTCGGVAARPHGDTAAPVEASAEGGEGIAAGKRYTDPESGIEVLCTKAGPGSLAFAGRPLARKDAKPLPASD